MAGKMWIGTACNVQVCVPMGVQVGREGGKGCGGDSPEGYICS